MANCGVYCITNIVNGHKYIGSAVNITKRWGQHTSHLHKNNHHSGYLQNAWNKYGEENFEFSVLEYCEIDYLIKCEQFYIDSEHPEYNMCPTAGSPLGYKHTETARSNMSEARKGKHPSEATRLKLSAAAKTRPPISEKTRAQMSAALKGNTRSLGNKLSEERKRKISEALKGKNIGNTNCLGRIVSNETREKMSEAQKGRLPISEETRCRMRDAKKGTHLSEETKHKISEAQTGRITTEETKHNISEARKGKPNGWLGKHQSEETKRKMSDAQKRRWAERNAKEAQMQSRFGIA